jgi:cysteine desulfurase
VNGPIYLDYQATTPLAPEAAAAMRPWLESNFANPHSSYRLGREAAAAVEVARQRVFEALTNPLPARRGGLGVGAHEASAAVSDTHPPPTPHGVQGGELYFTSGATEAINWALKGTAARLPPGRRRIVTLATEHAAVLDTVAWLAGQGVDVDILPVAPDGLVDLGTIEAALAQPTGLVAAMLVNNEIGVVQPVAEIGLPSPAATARCSCATRSRASAACRCRSAAATWWRCPPTRCTDQGHRRPVAWRTAWQ